MHPNFFRSSLFNLLFYILTGLSCIALLPTLVLPRRYYMAVVYSFVNVTWLLEKYVLGLRFVINGIENIPRSGAFIVACKHMSAYETFKLHILFKDPAVILKKELLKIPLWGRYLKKSDVIAIDRTTPKDAVRSIQEGARRVAAQKRPIIIFPQGTRVLPETTTQQKPYKIGVMRVQEATGLPIIPIATNTGVFYPKKGWSKHKGVITFEILPPMNYNPDADIGERLKELQTNVETRSTALIEEARLMISLRKKRNLAPFLTILILTACYSLYWFFVATKVEDAIVNHMANIKSNPNVSIYLYQPPKISGFPGKMIVDIPPQILEQDNQTIEISNIKAIGWPFPNMPIDINVAGIVINTAQWTAPAKFDRLNAKIRHSGDKLTLQLVELTSKRTKGIATGFITNLNGEYPEFDMVITIQNHEQFLNMLMDNRIIKENEGLLAGFALKALSREGAVKTKLQSRQNKLYLGPVKIHEFATIKENHAPVQRITPPEH